MGDDLKRREACTAFEGMQIFSATKARDREKLGETITSWIHKNRHLEIVDRHVQQSSDSEFHCVTVVLFYRHNTKAKKLVAEAKRPVAESAAETAA